MYKNRPQSRDARRARRKTSEKGKEWNYKDMKEVRLKHVEIARLATLGLKNVQIAQQVGLTKEAVSSILNNDTMMAGIIESYQTERDEETINIRRQIERIAPRAIALLEETIDFRPGEPSAETFTGNIPSIADQIRAASIIIDKSVSDKNVSEQPHITAKSITLIKERALQARENRKEVNYGDISEIRDEHIHESDHRTISTDECNEPMSSECNGADS